MKKQCCENLKGIQKSINLIFDLFQNSLDVKIKLAIIFGLLKCQLYILIRNHADIIFKIGGYTLSFPNPRVLRYLIKEILIEENYYIELENTNPFIIDCGSNLGMSILYFKLKYPNSNIVGIEADPVIFNLLKSNVEDMTNVEVYNRFVSIEENKNIIFYSGGAGDLRGSFNRIRGGVSELNINSISLLST